MGKAYRIQTAKDRLQKQQKDIKNLQAINRIRNTPRAVASTEFAGVSAAGERGGTGNFLRTEGDTMIGPLALAPPVDFSVDIDGSNTLDISQSSSNSQYSSNIQIEDVPTSSTLDIIKGAGFDGQILIIRTFAPPTITISQATMANGGNIQTPDDADFTMGDLQMINLVFDASLLVFANTGGTWRVSTDAGGATATVQSAWHEPVRASPLANVSLTLMDEVQDGVTLVEDDRVLLTLQTDASENGIYDVGVVTANQAPLTRSSDMNTSAETVAEIFVAVEEGTTNQDSLWHLITDNPIILDTTDQTWEEFGSVTQSAWHEPVRAKALADIPTLTTMAEVQDGVTLVEGDRVLLTEQTTASENGIYDVGVVTSNVAPITRAPDLDTSTELVAEIFVAIEEGSTIKNQVWHLISNNPLTIDSSSQLWEQFAPGTSGGPDMGGGEDGIDAVGQFVNDGRIAVVANYLKKWEQISDFLYPDNGPNDLIYLPSQFAAASVNGRLVMCGDSTQTRGASFSDDYGATWTLSGSISSNDNYVRMAYDPTGDILVAVSSNSASDEVNAIRFSTDRGTNFLTTNLANTQSFAFQDVIWVESDSQFVAVSSQTATAGIFTSPDGDNWTARTTPTPLTAGTWFDIAVNELTGLYIVKGNGGTDVMTSTDAGVTWTAFTTNISIGTFNRVISADGQEKFVGVVFDNVYISTDGIEWTIVFTFPDTAVVRDIIWAPELSTYLAIARPDAGATPPIFWFSNDAITWTNVPVNSMRKNDDNKFGTGVSLAAVAYAAEWGYFFGCGGDASTTTPFTDNALLWRTGVFFNGQETA